MEEIKTGLYRHFKGGTVFVYGIEKRLKMVLAQEWGMLACKMDNFVPDQLMTLTKW